MLTINKWWKNGIGLLGSLQIIWDLLQIWDRLWRNLLCIMTVKILGNKSPSSQQYLTTQENKRKSVLEMLHTPHRAQIDKANPVPLVLKREGGRRMEVYLPSHMEPWLLFTSSCSVDTVRGLQRRVTSPVTVLTSIFLFNIYGLKQSN